MIKNIIFDFGGILIDIDYEQTNIKLGRYLGVSDLNVPPFRDIMESYEVGAMQEHDFFSKLRDLAVMHVTLDDLKNGWNSMLGTLPMHRLQMLTELRKEHKVFLLSNTNFTHIAFVRSYLDKTYNLRDFESRYFDGVYYSHEINKRKPNSDIFEFVVQDLGLDKSETIFIDDSLANVEGARRVGIKSSLHNPDMDITKMIRRYLEE